MDESLFLVALLAAVAGGVGIGLLLRRVLRRRVEQSVAVARAEGEAARAKAEERLVLREEALAETKRERDEALRRLEAAGARDSELRAKLAETETRLAEERAKAEEKLALLADAEKKLAEAFSNLAGRALESNAESFLRQAKQAFETLQATAQGDLEQRRQSVEALVAPMREQLTRYESGVRELEKAREHAYGTLSEQVRGLLSSQEGLARETGRLVTALRRPEVRGNWGEMHLRAAVEFAGMLDVVDFEEQVTVETDEGRLRPDLVVKLPEGKRVVVDAKAPLDAYLAAVEAVDEEQRHAALVRHAKQVRTHLQKLAEKAYWNQFEQAPEFVVLFLPGEAFFTAALEKDPTLIEDSFKQSVLITTPATLVALLKTVSYAWRQAKLAENAREIAAAARELYDRIRVFSEHYATVGRGLESAVTAFNRSVGSFTSRVLPQGRRLEELGAGGGKLIAEPGAIDTAPRELPSGEPEPRDDELDA